MLPLTRQSCFPAVAAKRLSVAMRLRILKEETMKEVENDLMTDIIVAIQRLMPTGNLGG